MKSWRESAYLYTRPRILAQFLLGIPSGLPLALTAFTMTTWLKDAGMTLEEIGYFGAVALPYTFKFIWAPLLDGARLPFMGLRRGWMLVTQLAMVAAIFTMGVIDPLSEKPLFAMAAFMLAFFSASHDVVKDAYRVEILPVEQQAAGSASFVFGYRIAMLISGAGALYLSDQVGWHQTYALMAAVMLVSIVPLFFVSEPDAQPQAGVRRSAAAWLQEYVAMPFVEFMKRDKAVTILLFILLYRMTDGFIGSMASPFYKELGFTNSEIASVAKLYGLIATLLGGLIGGMVAYRFGVMRALVIGGIASAASNLMFVWQAGQGHDIIALIITISLDNISAALATTAFVAYMSQLANTRFTATQYALLTSLMAAGRTLLATPSGEAAKALGWEGFFLLSTVLIIPALLLMLRLPKVTAISPRAAATSE